MQQLFEKVITGAKTFEDRGPDSAEKWLYRIGRNCLIDHYRKQKREQDKRDDVEQQYAKHQRGSGQEDEEDRVLGALQQIPDGSQRTHKPHTITPEQTVHSQRIEHRFYECLEILPTEQRDVLHLTGIIGGMGKMTFAQAAEYLDITREGVKTRVRYARDKMKECLGALGDLSPW